MTQPNEVLTNIHKKTLIEIGYQEEIYTMTTLIYSPSTIEDYIRLMSQEDGVWQHEYIDHEGTCMICNDTAPHINQVNSNTDQISNYNADSITVRYERLLKERESQAPMIVQSTMTVSYKRIVVTETVEVNETQVLNPRCSTNSVNCLICSDDIIDPNELNAILLSCRHYCYHSCWYEYLRALITKGEESYCILTNNICL